MDIQREIASLVENIRRGHLVGSKDIPGAAREAVADMLDHGDIHRAVMLVIDTWPPTPLTSRLVGRLFALDVDMARHSDYASRPRIIVCGSRFVTEDNAVYDVVDRAIEEVGGRIIFVHGNSAGADRVVASYAQELGYTTEEHEANWRSFGRRAGPLRNAEMVDLGADLCLAFPMGTLASTPAAADCVLRAEQRSIPVWVTVLEPNDAYRDDAAREKTDQFRHDTYLDVG